MAREKFAIGTPMRLAIELINALALRRSDVIRSRTATHLPRPT